MDIRDRENESALLELYSKKTTTARWAGKTVHFDIPLTGFSSFQLDAGTLRLLRQIESDNPRWGHVLDLGCGYGPIAIHLSVSGLAARVTGIDRDALAVAFSRRNAEKNAIENCEFRGGLAYDDLSADDRYDAIVSNLPAKAGEPVHRQMLLGASQYLNPGGEVATVAVEPLEERIDGILNDEAVNVIQKIKSKGYIIYEFRFLAPVSVPPWPYTRESNRFDWREYDYKIESAFGLPEFDSLSWETEMIFKYLHDNQNKLQFERTVVWNPGQGHVPVFLHRLTDAVKQIALLSRDALSLRQSVLNLKNNSFGGTVQSYHTVLFQHSGVGEGFDLGIGILDDKEGLEINCEKIVQARSAWPNAIFLLACPVSFGLRLEKTLKGRGIRAGLVARHKGKCLLQCR